MYNICQEAINLIKAQEGLRLDAYLCPAGVWTIGYGHTGPEVVKGLKVTEAEAEDTLRSDLTLFASFVSAKCTVNPSENQFGAMVSLCFNIGKAGFAKSTVLRLHNQSKFPEASRAFLLWNQITVTDPVTKQKVKKVSNGLVARRAQESALYSRDITTVAEPMPQAVADEPTVDQSRTLQGSIASVTASVTSVAAMTTVLKDTANTLGDWLPWVLGVVAVLGGLYAIWAKIDDRRKGYK